jgi:thioredoxin 1
LSLAGRTLIRKLNNFKETGVKRSVRILAVFGFISMLALFCIQNLSYSAEEPTSVPGIPILGKVTMVDIGAKKCIPCKLMAPIMAELEKEYHDSGRAAIFFIDVWEHREQGPKFGIRTIPTQIFYDKTGKEVYRHEGFFDKKDIVAKLEELGVK